MILEQCILVLFLLQTTGHFQTHVRKYDGIRDCDNIVNVLTYMLISNIVSRI